MGLVLLPSGGCAAPQPVAQGKEYVILVGHGIVARDYSKEHLREWSDVHEHSHSSDVHDASRTEYALREREIREWPRIPQAESKTRSLIRYADSIRPDLVQPLAV